MLSLNILMVGDVFGEAGVKTAAQIIPEIRSELSVDLCVANGENATPRGVGINKAAANVLLSSGVDLITLGNHTFKDYDSQALLRSGAPIIRPANYPHGAPGEGAFIAQTPYGPVGVINLLGRLYLDPLDCPYAAVERELSKLKDRVSVIVVDMHAEATSEKCAVAWYLDGRVSFVAGTHTHVQTADERILPKGTAFITDLGMTGPADGVIGIEREIAIRKFRSSIPERYVPAGGRTQFCAALAEINPDCGKAVTITRIMRLIG